jgi:hypothetical protein
MMMLGRNVNNAEKKYCKTEKLSGPNHASALQAWATYQQEKAVPSQQQQLDQRIR